MAAVVHGVGTTSSSNVSSYASAGFTPAAGDLLVVFVIADGTVAAGSMSNSQGLTFNKAGSRTSAGGANTIYCFVAEQLAAAVSQTVTFSCTGDAATGSIIHVERVSGMAKTGAAAVRQLSGQNNQAAGGTPAPAFSAACLTGNPTLGCIGNASNPATLTPPTNWTERADQGHSTPSTGFETVSRDSGFTGTTITWGGTSATAFGSLIVELTTDNDGTAAITLGGVAASAAGIVDVAGALSGTLGAVALSAAGTAGSAEISGSASIAAGALSSSASGAVAVAGAVSIALGASSSAAAGEALITGGAAIALSAVQISAMGEIQVTGQATSPLAAVAASATGAVAVDGQSGVALAAMTLSAMGGAPAASGELAVALGNVAATASGAVQITGQATTSLGAVAGSASGQVAVIGALLRELGAVVPSGAGALGIAGQIAQVLAALQQAAAGEVSGIQADAPAHRSAKSAGYRGCRDGQRPEATDGRSLTTQSSARRSAGAGRNRGASL